MRRLPNAQMRLTRNSLTHNKSENDSSNDDKLVATGDLSHCSVLPSIPSKRIILRFKTTKAACLKQNSFFRNSTLLSRSCMLRFSPLLLFTFISEKYVSAIVTKRRDRYSNLFFNSVSEWKVFACIVFSVRTLFVQLLLQPSANLLLDSFLGSFTKASSC